MIPSEAQMRQAIAQILSMPFAYNSPVMVLDFDLGDKDTDKITGRFKDLSRPRVFSFNIEGQSVTFKPYAPGRMDSAEDWEEFSSGYSYRVDAGIGGNKKPQCVKPTAYNCGAACINIMKSCKTKTDDPTIKDRLKNLNEIGKDYAETVKTTKTPKISEPAKTAKVDPKTEAEKPTEKPTEKPVEKPVEKQTQEKTKPLSIAQKNAQTIENLAKKAGVDVSKLVETARKAGATEAQLLTLKNGVANYMKAKGIVPGSELKTTRSEEEGLTGDGSHEVGKLTPSVASIKEMEKTAEEWIDESGKYITLAKKVLKQFPDGEIIKYGNNKEIERDVLKKKIGLVDDSKIVAYGLGISAEEIEPGVQDAVFLKDESGKTQGFFLTGNDKSKESMYIEFLGTNPSNIIKGTKGVGKQIIYHAIKESVKRGFKGKIKLEALRSAEPFYEAVGFKKHIVDNTQFEDAYFELSEESAKAFVEKYEKTLK